MECSVTRVFYPSQPPPETPRSIAPTASSPPWTPGSPSTPASGPNPSAPLVPVSPYAQAVPPCPPRSISPTSPFDCPPHSSNISHHILLDKPLTICYIFLRRGQRSRQPGPTPKGGLNVRHRLTFAPRPLPLLRHPLPNSPTPSISSRRPPTASPSTTKRTHFSTPRACLLPP